MRILMLGAGGIGGYFGGRLAQAGVDVAFLVRPRRAAQLAANGLVVRSEMGDLDIPVQTVLSETAGPGYDAILLSCKAYDLDDAIAAIRPAAPGALIVPLLNGMRHLDALDAAFGQTAVTGGVAQIGVTLEDDGTVRHFGRGVGFIFGERDASQTARCEGLQAELAKGGFGPRHSGEIMQDMWEKFAFLCTLAGMCCLMRGGVGPIVRTTSGSALLLDMYGECAAVAEASGHKPRARALENVHAALSDINSAAVPSMLRDLRRGGKVEGDHIVGDMLARAQAAGTPSALLRTAYTNLQVYQSAG